jgi:hypothetical protein
MMHDALRGDVLSVFAAESAADREAGMIEFGWTRYVRIYCY